MKKLVVLKGLGLWLAILSFGTVLSEPVPGGQVVREEDLHTATPLIKECNERTAAGNPIERRGCCSWHGGVCGCDGGRTRCCDGTLSPTCGC